MKKFTSENYIFYLVIILILSYTIIYSLINISRYNHFEGTFGFDLSIQDQGIWLLSQGKTPFVTVRGLHIFGDHTPYFYLFIALLYRLWDSIYTLLIFHTFFIALGALPVFLISKHILKKTCLSLFFSFAYLLYVPLTYLNLDLLFSESFSTTLLLFAFYFLLKKNFILHYISLFLVLLCKEDIFIIVFMIGVYTFFKIDKKKGIVTCVLSVLWFILNIFVLLPYFNGMGYFRHLYGYSVFGQFGHTPTEVIKTIFFEPGVWLKVLFTSTNLNYIFQLLLPFFFISLIGLPELLIAVPTILTNIMGGYYYTHFISYHYTATIIPFIVISAIYGIKRFVNKRMFPLVFILILISLVASTKEIGPYYSLVSNPDGIKYAINKVNTYSNKEIELHRAIENVPLDASVSASYNLLPHLSHREKIYVFPVPFEAFYWGINGENLPDRNVDYFLFDKGALDKAKFNKYLQPQLNKTYSVEINSSNVLLIKRK